ncbi:MAG: HAMP domain-containing protein [Anaerolineaceae bacterium]|nr:MAG: HAMP domain-containing protein [Anaerolineaceae bacterium]
MRFQKNTISFRLLTLLLIIFFILISLVTVNNAIAINDIQNNAYQTMEETLAVYNNRINDNFNKVENYLVNFAYDDLDIRILDTKDPSSTQWFSALYRLQKNFTNSLPIYEMNGFFLYSAPQDTLITEAGSNFSFKTLNIIKGHIRSLMQDKNFTNTLNTKSWFPVLIDDQYYLFRVLQIHDSYVGSWINTDTTLYPLVGSELNDYIFLINCDGKVLNSSAPISSLSPDVFIYPENNPLDDHLIEINGKTNLLVSHKMDLMDSYIVSLVPKSKFFNETQFYLILLIIALLFIFCLMILTVIITKRWVIKPLSDLSVAITSLRNGDFDTILSTKNVSAEFNDVYQGFNEMVQRIKTLKINVYEEKLSKQGVQMKYLKLQTTPHFLINCLSMVYQLIKLDKTDLSIIMLKDLSNHLRYTLTSEKTVTLEQELMHVENYVELSSIRYPNAINLHTDCTADSLRATVIPLIIQNFVENTIKYEVEIDKQINIYVSSHLEERNNIKYLVISIWDTGSGYNEKILKKLQNMSQYVKNNRSPHIGISNVYERASLLFGENNFEFRFSNRPGAGAGVDIELPFIPLIREEED